MGVREPGRAFVVELGEGALFEQLGALLVARHDARVTDRPNAAGVRIVDVELPGTVHRAGELEDLFSHPLRRIQPVAAQLVELFSGGRDRGDARIALRLLPRRPGEGECFEAGGGGVAEARLLLPELSALRERPDLVQVRVEDAEEVVVGSSEGEYAIVDKEYLREPREDAMFSYPWCGDVSRQ